MSNILKTAALAVLLAALPAAAAEFNARLASQDPPTTAKHRGLLKAAELIKQRTNGAVEIQVFPSSQLGGAREMGEGVQLGSLEAMIAPASFLGGFNPAVSIFDVPYIFPTDRAKSRTLREGKLGTAVLDSFAKRGFEPVALTRHVSHLLVGAQRDGPPQGRLRRQIIADVGVGLREQRPAAPGRFVDHSNGVQGARDVPTFGLNLRNPAERLCPSANVFEGSRRELLRIGNAVVAARHP